MVKRAQNADTQKTAAADGSSAWRPEPGEEFTGTVTKVGVYDSDYGKVPVITYDTPDGVIRVYAFHRALEMRLREMKPRGGEIHTVKYFGKVDSKNVDEETGEVFQYHKYSVTESPW
jgi:hypothetical protein